MKFEPKLREMSAEEITYTKDGRRAYLIDVGNRVLVVDAALLESLFKPIHDDDQAPMTINMHGAESTRTPEKRTAAFHVKRSEPKAAAPKAPEEPRGPSVRERVLAALGKKPMSSIELTDELRCAPAGVYEATIRLKNAGEIVGKTDDEHDGTRRWYLTNGAASGATA